MNTSAFWMIVLGLWIFTLQSRIKQLEQKIQELGRKSKTSSRKKDVLKAEQSSVSTLDEERSVERGKVVKIPYAGAVAQFKADHTASEELTDDILPEKVPETNEPSWFMQMLTSYFTGGNLLVRIGGVILFFGLAFLVKYASEHITVSIELRLLSVLLVGIVLIALGWKFRAKEGAYGQILQGLGVAVLYLVIYAASKFYAFLSLESAFVWMFLVVILGSLLALKQSSLPLALFSTAGGFLVPILTATGSGSHVLLFSYYLLLNLGVFFMAWRHTWRILNVIGFLFTFIIAASWGVLRYQPEFFGTTEPFLILYFLMYLGITVLFAHKSKGHLIDGMLLFGLPAVVFPLQVHLVSGIEYGGAYSALAIGTLYLLLAKILSGKTPSMLLLESFSGLGILFYTVAIPYFFKADITAAVWAMESSAVIWLSLRQKKIFVRYFGELLLLVSIGLYLVSQVGNNIIEFSEYSGYLIVVVSSFFAAYQLEKNRKDLAADRYLPILFLLLSFCVWMISVHAVAVAYVHYGLMHKLLLGFLVGTLLLSLADKLLKWPLLGRVLQLTLPAGAVIFLLSFVDKPYPWNPFEGLGAPVFILLMVWHTVLLYRYDKKWQFANYLHILSLWFSVAVLTLALHYRTIEGGASSTMVLLSIAILPFLYALLLMKVSLDKAGLSPYTKLYRYIGAGGLLVFLFLWEVTALFARADILVLPYVPVFNLLDLMQIAVLYMIYDWAKYHQKEKRLFPLLYLMAMVLVTIVFARAIAHYGGYSYSMKGVWPVLYFQTGLSLLWSGIALVLMFLSKKYRHRGLWLAGFGLLCVVVLKLFFVELSGSGTMERIISFIVVGILLLLVGYFVPMPPSGKIENSSKE